MIIKSAYNFDVTPGKQTFSPMINEYGYSLDLNGKRIFSKIGEKNIYAEIQRDKNSCDYSIIKQFLINTPSMADKGIFGDRSLETNDLIESTEFMEKCQSMYDNLPKEVKSKYKTLMEFVYGFSEKDFNLFSQDVQVDSSYGSINKGVNEDEQKQ